MTSQNPTTDDTGTSQNGHCEHCVDCATDYFPKYGRHADSLGWAWDSKMCPKCAAKAERERIAKWMKEQGWESLRPGGTSQLLADAIERGDHLKESI